MKRYMLFLQDESSRQWKLSAVGRSCSPVVIVLIELPLAFRIADNFGLSVEEVFDKTNV